MPKARRYPIVTEMEDSQCLVIPGGMRGRFDILNVVEVLVKNISVGKTVHNLYHMPVMKLLHSRHLYIEQI